MLVGDDIPVFSYSLRQLVSLESGLWQFVCENRLQKDNYSIWGKTADTTNIPYDPDNTTRTEESFFAIYDPLADILRFEAQINNREQAMNDDPYPIYYRFGDIGDQPYEYNQETATFIINDIYTELPTVIE